METAQSPMSSNISSFYEDRIEELLPQRKHVGEKLFKDKEEEYHHEEDYENFVSPPLKKTFQPAPDLKKVERPRRKPKFNWKPLTAFQKRKEKLRDRLTLFGSKKEYQKNKKRKNTAQALKFLRKLGTKLRKPASVAKRRINVTTSRKRTEEYNNLFNSSPVKSIFTSQSPETKVIFSISRIQISPRQALMQYQQDHP